MIICHQCGNKILTFSNINKIRCPKCRAEYVSKSNERNSTDEMAKPNIPAVSNVVESPYNEPVTSINEDFDKTYIKNPTDFAESPIPEAEKIKVGLKFLGTFELSFLEKIKTTPNSLIYQREVKNSMLDSSAGQNIFYLPKSSVLIGRRPAQTEGFEDVDIKMDSRDTSISRRQCQIETIITGKDAKTSISTHPKASNLIEINGKIVEKGIKMSVSNGDFIRLGNSIFEICIISPIQEKIDDGKTVIYQNYK